MNHQPLLAFTAIGAVGYVVFHGHRANQDCFLCPWRGITFAAGSLILGTVIALNED